LGGGGALGVQRHDESITRIQGYRGVKVGVEGYALVIPAAQRSHAAHARLRFAAPAASSLAPRRQRPPSGVAKTLTAARAAKPDSRTLLPHSAPLRRQQQQGTAGWGAAPPRRTAHGAARHVAAEWGAASPYLCCWCHRRRTEAAGWGAASPLPVLLVPSTEERGGRVGRSSDPAPNPVPPTCAAGTIGGGEDMGRWAATPSARSRPAGGGMRQVMGSWWAGGGTAVGGWWQGGGRVMGSW